MSRVIFGISAHDPGTFGVARAILAQPRVVDLGSAPAVPLP
jgi:hypothetical protein